MFKYICCLLVSMLSCYVFASQMEVENSLSNKVTIPLEHGADNYLKGASKRTDSKSKTAMEIQKDKEKNPKSEKQELISIKKEKEYIEERGTKTKVVKISPTDNVVKIVVTTEKKNHEIMSYEVAVAIGIPLIILFVTNIVTLFKIRAESKAAIRNELSMNHIKLKKDQLSLFYDPIIALLNTNSEVFSAFGPKTFPEDPHLGEEALHIWDILVNTVILPNNNEIVTIIKKNTHLLSSEDNFEIYLRFMKHAVSYEAFRDTPNELHGNFRYPKEILPNVKKYRGKVLNDLRAIEMKLK